jgi:hypothetical protein
VGDLYSFHADILSKAFTRIGFGHGSPSIDTEGPCLYIQPQPVSGSLAPHLPKKVAAMRIVIHYLIAVVILTVYGGQV